MFESDVSRFHLITFILQVSVLHTATSSFVRWNRSFPMGLWNALRRRRSNCLSRKKTELLVHIFLQSCSAQNHKQRFPPLHNYQYNYSKPQQSPVEHCHRYRTEVKTLSATATASAILIPKGQKPTLHLSYLHTYISQLQVNSASHSNARTLIFWENEGFQIMEHLI